LVKLLIFQVEKKTKQRKPEQQSNLEEIEIFKEFVVLKDNKENPCACMRVYKMK